jgi:regulator of RNase E activity RraA
MGPPAMIRPEDSDGHDLATVDERADFEGQLGQVSCASLVDAMGRRHGHRAHFLPLVSPTPARPLFGPAATIGFLPARADLDDLPDFADVFYEAIGPRPQGRVLVLSSGGHPDASHAGGTKLSRVQHHGLAGVVSDGRLRDFDQLAGYDFATWCRGEATRWGGDTVMPYAAGQPVSSRRGCVDARRLHLRRRIRRGRDTGHRRRVRARRGPTDRDRGRDARRAHPRRATPRTAGRP